MCGIVGVLVTDSANQTLYDALVILQHRGQDAAGILTSHGNRFYLRKDNGLVSDVFRSHHMARLPGRCGIGHVRYPTAGSASSAEAQPFYVNSPYGMALAHNGNLVNVDALKAELFDTELRHINTGSDSEVLLNMLASELQKQGRMPFQPSGLFDAIDRVSERCQGGYAAVAMINGHGLLGFRDPHGIRPLVYGRRQKADGAFEHMLASESAALTALGFDVVKDIGPGAALFVSQQGEVYEHTVGDGCRPTPCLFEYVYFARPDSTIDGISVYQSRLRMGEKLANQVKTVWPQHDIDVIMPVPDSSRPAAMEMARCLQLPYREGLVKNRYIGRTFIMPGQQLRERSVRQKLSAISSEFDNKNVMLVDDSIVRGTTCRQIIEMARQAGARNVYLSSAAPAIRHPNVYGIDMPAHSELIAHNRSDDEVAALVGADRLFYQELSDLVEAVRHDNLAIAEFECSVFNGVYTAGHVDKAYLASLVETRRRGSHTETAELGLHNAAEL